MRVRAVVVWLRQPVLLADGEWKLKLEFEADTGATPLPGGDVRVHLVKFVTASGKTLFVPEDVIAWIELGAETELAE